MRAPVLAATLASVLAACTDAQLGVTAQEVIGGSATPAGEFPGVGALMYVDGFPGQEPEAGCTGTLIAPDAVLTAAHCLDPDVVGPGIPGFTLTHDTYQSPVVVAGRQAIVHESFDIDAALGPGLAQFFDIGVLLLAQPITDVAPVRMIRRAEVAELVADLDLSIVGYGRIDNATDESGVKYDAATTLVSLNPSELQVSAGQGQPQNCHGDSGGPALAELEAGQRIVGTVSRSFDLTAECLNGGIDTRVDFYLDWVHAKVTTGIPCGSGLAEACADDGEVDEGGCCSTGSRPGAGSLALAGAVLAGVRRRRARRPA